MSAVSSRGVTVCGVPPLQPLVWGVLPLPAEQDMQGTAAWVSADLLEGQAGSSGPSPLAGWSWFTKGEAISWLKPSLLQLRKVPLLVERKTSRAGEHVRNGPPAAGSDVCTCTFLTQLGQKGTGCPQSLPV